MEDRDPDPDMEGKGHNLGTPRRVSRISGKSGKVRTEDMVPDPDTADRDRIWSIDPGVPRTSDRLGKLGKGHRADMEDLPGREEAPAGVPERSPNQDPPQPSLPET
jgi:hypothetical protein